LGIIAMSVPRLRLIAGRYFWRPTKAVKALGFANESLGSDLHTAIARARDLNKQVEKAKSGIKDSPQPKARTISALIDAYQGSAGYTALKRSTVPAYDCVLREIRSRAGDHMVADIDRAGLKETYLKLQKRGLSVANLHMRIWRMLLNVAVDSGWINANPAAKLNLTAPPERETVWTPDQAAQFCEAALADGSPQIRLAFLLAYDLGQRMGDILKLSWSNYTGNGFRIKQSKTKAHINVPFENPFLWAEIDSMDRKGALVLLMAKDRPWREAYFSHECTRIRRLAKLPEDLKFRDLRRTAATESGDGGASEDQMRAQFGWRSRQVISRYVRPTDKMAGDAQEKRRKNRSKG
jgi:integrase